MKNIKKIGLLALLLAPLALSACGGGGGGTPPNPPPQPPPGSTGSITVTNEGVVSAPAVTEKHSR
jgi:hypothetical protein